MAKIEIRNKCYKQVLKFEKSSQRHANLKNAFPTRDW